MSRFTPLLGALGGVAILFGMASLLLSVFSPGIALWDLSWIWGNFVLGALLTVAWLVLGFEGLRERMSSGEARRVGTYGSSAVISTVLSIAIVAAAGYFAARNPVRFDWTEAGVHSLSEQTTKVLEGLERDAEVTALFSRMDQLGVKPLLDRYAYASERFHYTLADPNERPDLVQTLGVEREQLKGGILHVAIGGESTNLDEVTEEKLTNALVKLTRTGEKKVYLLVGHNERPFEGSGADEAHGLSRAVQALANENYVTEPLLLASVGDVPEDADAVIVAGPTRPLLAAEEAALERYLERGGSLLVMVDPRANTNLYGPLARWGVSLGDDVVIDRRLAVFGQATSPLANEYPSHPINAGLRDYTLFRLVRSVQARPEARKAFTEIVRTSEESWAERSLDGATVEQGPDDLAGPVSIAVAGEVALGDGAGEEGADPADPGPRGRLVVFGDSDFASNEFLDAYRNRDLFLNSVNWLLGDVDAISIRPAAGRASRFNPSQEQFSTIRYLSLLVLPEMVAMLGVLAWWWRRRAPGR